jgi:hypothetical protein
MGEPDRHRRFADATFRARHGDYVVDRWQLDHLRVGFDGENPDAIVVIDGECRAVYLSDHAFGKIFGETGARHLVRFY